MSCIHFLNRYSWGDWHPVLLAPEDRYCHTYILGKTGSGKSTLLRNILVNEISEGRGVGLIDPHGDLSGEILDCIPSHRLDDVVYFNPGDIENPCSFNVLRTSGTPDLIASSVVSAFKNIWRDSWGPRLEYILYAGVAALAECENVSLLGIPRLLTDFAYRQWVVRQVKDPLVRSFWANEFEDYDKRYRTEAVSPILNKVGQFLMSPTIRNILGQVGNKIDFTRILDNEQIFIARLPKAKLGEEKCRLLGSLLVSQFQMSAMGRAEQPSHSRTNFGLCIDEFQNFLTESFCTILSESRKYGLHLTLSHQYLDQLEPEIRTAVLGNVGGIISFRLGHSDAEVIAGEMNGFEASAFTDLPKFEAVAKLQINGEQADPFFCRSLPPSGACHGNTEKIVNRSRERFCSSRQRVEEKVNRWLA